MDYHEGMLAFDDLFESGTLTTDRDIGKQYTTIGPDAFKAVDFTKSGRTHYIRHKVSGFVIQRRGHNGPSVFGCSFWAKPTPTLLRLACQSTLAIKHDEVYFEAVVFQDFVDLYAKNNQILNTGGPIATIPTKDWVAKVVGS